MTILFENEDILAVEKPPGISVIPERTREQNSLLAILSAQFSTKVYVVHRIDKEVSGVVVFAKNAAAHRFISMQFERREVEKAYLALVWGSIVPDRGTIDAPLRQFGSGRMGVDVQRGKPSRTQFEVLRRSAEFSFVSAHPLTGRRHQLRVHFYHIGHPIAGDPKYGDKAVQGQFPRIMLHAHRITLTIPSQTTITIESSIPDSFSQELGRVFREPIIT